MGVESNHVLCVSSFDLTDQVHIYMHSEMIYKLKKENKFCITKCVRGSQKFSFSLYPYNASGRPGRICWGFFDDKNLCVLFVESFLGNTCLTMVPEIN